MEADTLERVEEVDEDNVDMRVYEDVIGDLIDLESTRTVDGDADEEDLDTFANEFSKVTVEETDKV
jgi:hypothetical protein